MAKARDIPGCGSATAAEGARLVLRTRLEEFFSFREAALDWSDPEGVHDMRVASRRLRSAAADFRRLLPKSRLKRLRRRVRELAGALGEVRDADVALAALAEIAARTPPELAAGLESFSAATRARREQARARLAEALAAGEAERLGEELAALLAPPSASESEAGAGDEDSSGQGGASDQTFGEAGRGIVAERLREFAESGASLFRPHDSEGLHDLRIAAKSLRYALELFASCLGDDLRHYAKEIARLQNSLGLLHDCDVWTEELGGRLSARPAKKGKKGRGKKGKKGEGGESEDEATGEAAQTDAARVAAGQDDAARDGAAQDDAAQDDARGSVESPPLLAHASPERRAALWLLRHFARERARHYEDALARWHAWENYGLLARVGESVSAPAGQAGTGARKDD